MKFFYQKSLFCKKIDFRSFFVGDHRGNKLATFQQRSVANFSESSRIDFFLKFLDFLKILKVQNADRRPAMVSNVKVIGKDI